MIEHSPIKKKKRVASLDYIPPTTTISETSENLFSSLDKEMEEENTEIHMIGLFYSDHEWEISDYIYSIGALAKG